jgi:hypothetical protein
LCVDRVDQVKLVGHTHSHWTASFDPSARAEKAEFEAERD